MKRPVSQTLAERAEKEPAESRTAKATPALIPTSSRNEVPERPTAAYLRHLILALAGDATTPLVIQAECVKLMRAISANNLIEITELVVRLGHLADAEGFTLPRLDREPSQGE